MLFRSPKLTKSQSTRMSQNAKAMTYSVLATLAIVLGWMALNPQADNDYDPGVDVAIAEEQVSKVAAFSPATIDAPGSWRPNYARWDSGAKNDVPVWKVGYVTGDDDFFGISQTANATPAWVEAQIEPVGESTQRTVAGHNVTRWVGEDDHVYLVAEFDQQANSPQTSQQGNTIEPSDTMTLIVSGSMDEDRLEQLAAEVFNQYQ